MIEGAIIDVDTAHCSSVLVPPFRPLSPDRRSSAHWYSGPTARPSRRVRFARNSKAGRRRSLGGSTRGLEPRRIGSSDPNRRDFGQRWFRRPPRGDRWASSLGRYARHAERQPSHALLPSFRRQVGHPGTSIAFERCCFTEGDRPRRSRCPLVSFRDHLGTSRATSERVADGAFPPGGRP